MSEQTTKLAARRKSEAEIRADERVIVVNAIKNRLRRIVVEGDGFSVEAMIYAIRLCINEAERERVKHE